MLYKQKNIEESDPITIVKNKHLGIKVFAFHPIHVFLIQNVYLDTKIQESGLNFQKN